MFTTDPTYIDEWYISAYDWMSAQLAKKVSPPIMKGVPIKHPVWAWCVAHDTKKPKPDLRYGGYLSAGTDGVRIEFVIDKEQMLLSDFIGWHAVLNDFCHCQTDDEFDYYDNLQKTLNKSDFDKIKEQSWHGIFDLDDAPNDTAIQAVFWQLKYEWVTRVDYFKAR